jgi:hypothetical protein
MKAVIIGTDLVKTNSGEIKMLEMNTNVGVLSSGTQFLNFNGLTQFIIDNGFTELHILANSRNFIGRNIPHKEDPTSLWSLIKSIADETNVTFFDYEIPLSSNTVPYIEDSDDKLILRLAYDASAIIDSEYAANKTNLVNLLNGKGYSIKSYIKDGLDTIGNESFTYNSNEPNYIIKKTYTSDDRNEFPQVFVIHNEQELLILKENLKSDEILQEYHHSELTDDGKLSIIRSIDILYGSNLDTIHLGSYGVKHQVQLGSVNTIDNSNKISKVDRLKYITYTSSRAGSVSYIIDSDSSILMGDGSQKIASELVIGDVVKTIDVVDLPIHERDYKTYEWTGSFSKLQTESTVTTTTVVDVVFVEETRIFTKVTTLDGKTWSDLPTSDILTREGEDIIKFKPLSDFIIGDVILFFNIETESFVEDSISSIEYEFKTILIGQMDVEPVDLFLPIIDGGFSLIQHNLCGTKCKIQSPCPNPSNSQCNTCTTAQCIQK